MSKFDWVQARSDCTVEKVFEMLAEDVQRDLARHNDLNPGLAQSQKFERCGEDKFFVEKSDVHRIIFEKTTKHIRVGKWERHGQHEPMLNLAVRLGEDGKCILIDDEHQTLKPWQVRRIALEETLFGNA